MFHAFLLLIRNSISYYAVMGKNILLQGAVVICLLLMISISAGAQEESKDIFKVRSFGLSLGVYDPDLDYWKNDTNSEFLNSEFSTNIFARGFVEISIVKNLVAQAAIGYWQTRAETRIPKFGKTTMLLTGTPVSIDLIYYIAPARIAFVTPYAGVGGELLLIQYSLDFEDKENPEPVGGSSALLSGLFGLEAKLSDHFSIDVTAAYKSGNYQQSFVREVPAPDPDNPASEAEFVEDISLTGPSFGISFKYHF